MPDDGMRSLVRCYINGKFVGYRVFKASWCRADDPNVVIHNLSLAEIIQFRKLVEDPV